MATRFVLAGDIDSFFEKEQDKTNKILQESSRDLDAFDPWGEGNINLDKFIILRCFIIVGFQAHLKTKRFDRRLFETLKQEHGGQECLEKYMDERKQNVPGPAKKSGPNGGGPSATRLRFLKS